MLSSHWPQMNSEASKGTRSIAVWLILHCY
jgi:hypothetical protein